LVAAAISYRLAGSDVELPFSAPEVSLLLESADFLESSDPLELFDLPSDEDAVAEPLLAWPLSFDEPLA
jgi:hypothetical protein